MVENIAKSVIEKCGGAAKTAALCGCTKSWVYKWTLPKAQSGRDGRVPERERDLLLAAASRGEVDLSLEDFFPNAPKSSEGAEA